MATIPSSVFNTIQKEDEDKSDKIEKNLNQDLVKKKEYDIDTPKSREWKSRLDQIGESVT